MSLSLTHTPREVRLTSCPFPCRRAPAPPRCDLVRASRTRVRQVHVTQRGPAVGVRPGLRAVARADGRHASGRGGARRGRRRGNHPERKESGRDIVSRADTAALVATARRTLERRGLRQKRYEGRGCEGREGFSRETLSNRSRRPSTNGKERRGGARTRRARRREKKEKATENGARRVTRRRRRARRAVGERDETLGEASRVRAPARARVFDAPSEQAVARPAYGRTG